MMKTLTKGLLILFSSLLLTACGSLSNPFAGVNDDKVATLQIAEKVKTSDLYGAWAIASDEEESKTLDYTYIVLMIPNKSGLLLLTIDDKKAKTFSQYSEFFTWSFKEKDKVLTMNSFKRKSVENGKEKIEALKDIDNYDVQVYKAGKDILAIRFTGEDGIFTFLKMDDEIYNDFIKDTPELKPLRR